MTIIIPTGRYIMTSTTEKTTTKEKIMDAATCLMLDKGFVATTVDEICECAGVTKGSFFYYFKNKETLGKELVGRFGQKMGEKMMPGIMSKEDPLERVFAYIDFGMHFSKSDDFKGCLAGTFTQELHQSHPEIRSCCDQGFKGVIQAFKNDLTLAIEKYKPKTKIDVEAVAESFVAMGQGSMILMKASQDRNTMERTYKQFRKYLELLFAK